MSQQQPSPTVVTETVKELRDAARDLLGDEAARASSLNARGTALAGFVGVILSVAAAAGSGVGTGSTAELDHWVRVLVAAAVAAALAVLAAAIVTVVWKVLLPQPGITIALDDTDRWIEAEFTDRQAVMTNGYLLDGYTQALRVERNRNDHKAKWLGRSYIVVCVGLALVAIAGASATIDRYAGGGHETGSGTHGRSGIYADVHGRR